MDQSVTLRFTPNQQDYAKVLRIFFWQRIGTRISLLFLVIAFGLMCYMIISQGVTPTIFEMVWLFLPPLFVIFLFIVQPLQMANRAVKNEQLIAETAWQVSPAGVQISSRFGSAQLDWEKLTKLVKTADYYLLLSKANKNTFRFLPRRAFTSSQEQDLFLQLIADHLSKG